MIYGKFIKRGLAFALSFVMVLSIFAGAPLFRYTAGAVSAGNYTALNVTYTAKARVDESIGLRASASIGTAVGITPLETRLIRNNATHTADNDDNLQVVITPYDRYSLTQVVVVAIATITHPHPSGIGWGTKEAVKDITSYEPGDTGVTASGANFSYSVPDFRDYVSDGDKIDVEIILYADLKYTINTATDYVATIDVADRTYTANGASGSIAGLDGTGTARIRIDAASVAGPIRIIGDALNRCQIEVYNTVESGTNIAQRRVDLILDDVRIVAGVDATMTNYTTHISTYGSPTPSFSQPRNLAAQTGTAASFTRWATTAAVTATVYAPLSIVNADVYVTLAGASANDNVLALTSASQSSAQRQNGIYVDASASLIITDASGDKKLYARGGGCSAGIGSTGVAPAGYIEIDGGDLTALSVYSSHCYSGIGNGGHYTASDPGIRGFVMNGGKVNAFGYHYGIGGNGGATASGNALSAATGPTYLIVTGGEVVSEAGASSAGAAFGFAYNNNIHSIRIGRPDKDDSPYDPIAKTGSTVFSVNWGYGAAISGVMTFYSGKTSAYSGQYAAAIGGNAVSNADTVLITASDAQGASSAVAGTPLSVYGGDVTAVAGAFEQGVYTYGGGGPPASGTVTDYSIIRGGQGWFGSTEGNSGFNVRNSAASVLVEPRPATSYGAAIGGAVGKPGGDTNNIFAGTFNVTSSVYGAGIGGGGAYNTSQSVATVIRGGDTWIGNLYDNNNRTRALSIAKVLPMDFTITSGTYGAGIGGGGSTTGSAGNGGDLYISGGSFNVQTGRFGAGIGGGGSNAGNAGSGGNVTITGGEKFTINSGEFGAGIGGGGTNSSSAVRSGGNGGNVIISGDSFGSFEINSGVYGAGIGGGGSLSGQAGSGGTSLLIDCVTDHTLVAKWDSTLNGGLGDIAPSKSNFIVNSGQFGAGIGGGGSGTSSGGAGPATLTINGGNFGITAGGNDTTGYNTGTYPTPGRDSSFGAGIGGGGSYEGKGGNGPDSAEINGGYFDVSSEGYGAAIGGGGSFGTTTTPPAAAATGGTGGTATYNGGTVVVKVPMKDEEITDLQGNVIATIQVSLLGSVGMGGGHNPTEGSNDFPNSSTTDGTVIILGGNISTEITSIPPGLDASQHAWTPPFPEDAIDGTSTTSATKVTLGKDLIGAKVEQVFFTYNNALYPDYETNDLYITGDYDEQGKLIGGVAWIWAPSYLKLTYDLNSGSKRDTLDPLGPFQYSSIVYNDGTDHINDFDIEFAERIAVGNIILRLEGSGTGYTYDGETKSLVQPQDLLKGDIRFDGALWGNYAAWFHAGDGNMLYKLLEHEPADFTRTDPADGISKFVPIYFVGWTDNDKGKAKLAEAGIGGEDKIFEKNDADTELFKSLLVNSVQFEADDIEVYAMWGYDINFNGLPDILELDYKLTYDPNVLVPDPSIKVPVNPLAYSYGTTARVAALTESNTPTRDGYVFVAWTNMADDDLDINTLFDKDEGSGNITLTSIVSDKIYLGASNSSDASATRSFGSYGSITGDSDVLIGFAGTTINALWAVDDNGNGIPDFLEPKIELVHVADGPGYTTGDAFNVPDNKVYVAGVTGKTTESILYSPKMYYDDFTHGDFHPPAYTEPVYIFLGWTEEALFNNKDGKPNYVLTEKDKGFDLSAYVHGDPLTLSTPFAVGETERKVYAIWGEDTNNNGTPDYLEDGQLFIYDPKTDKNNVKGIPPENRPYYENELVDDDWNDPYMYHFDIDDPFKTKPTDPYMERDGWVFLGWLDYELGQLSGLTTTFTQHDFTKQNAIDYEIANAKYPDKDLPFLTAPLDSTPNWPTYFTFNDTDDIRIYAVWGQDRNNNGIPDWYDEEGRSVKYVPNLPAGTLVGNMPVPETYPGSDTYLDEKGGGGYSKYETVQIDYSSVPTSTGYVFLGWSPMSAYDLVFNISQKTKFYQQLALLKDILSFDASTYDSTTTPPTMPTFNNLSGYQNVVAKPGNPYFPVGPNLTAPYAPVLYTLTPGLDYAYEISLAANNLETGYGSVIWWRDFVAGMGFPNSVTFDWFDTPNNWDQMGGTSGEPNGFKQIQLYGVWAVDSNLNGIADMFEDAYRLIYERNGGSGGDATNGEYLPGETVYLVYKDPPSKLGDDGNPLFFLGWTATDKNKDGTPLKDYYSYGDIDILPDMAGGVTFGNYDITVTAIWAEDKYGGAGGGSNNIPDVYESGVKLSYDGKYSGVTNVPLSESFPYNTTAKVSLQVPVHPAGYPFLEWNTMIDGKGISYAPGDDILNFTNNLTLYAQWDEPIVATYTLKYDANGGSGAPDPYISTSRDRVPVAATKPTHPNGYIFLYWTLDSNVAPFYTYGDRLNLPEEILFVSLDAEITTLYAVWSTDKDQNQRPDAYEYTVEYDANGAAATPTDLIDYSSPYEYNDVVWVKQDPGMIPPDPTKSFHGWNTNPNGWGINYLWPDFFNITENTILYAMWDIPVQRIFAVTFDPNGGTVAPTSAQTGTDGKLTSLPTPTRSDYTFDGWFTASSGGTKVDTSRVYTADTTIYAQWTYSGGGNNGNTGGNGGNPGGSTGGGGGNQNVVLQKYTLTFVTNGGTTIAPVVADEGTRISLSSYKPTREGYKFDGWYADEDLTVLARSVTLTSDMTVYAKWISTEPEIDTEADYILTFETNGGTEIASITAKYATEIDLSPFFTLKVGYMFAGWYSDAELTQPVSSVTLFGNRTVYAKWASGEIPSDFETDHVAYIIGYEDGTVHPNANITRAEVALIFYRILREDVRAANFTDTNSFEDVEESWYSDAVSTLSKMGIIVGYEDGTFRPGRTITRAEFATIAARFIKEQYAGPNMFADAEGHWGEEFINRAANHGWILGYEDGSFRPDREITRAEAMAMINRILCRLPETPDDLLEGMRTFTDNSDTSAWYYTIVQEAASGHDYELKEDGVHEYWTSLWN